MRKCIVVFSGGPDSTAAALWAQDQGFEVELLTLHFYSPSQDSEVAAAGNVAQSMGIKHTIADLRCLMPTFGPPITILMHGIDRHGKNIGNATISSSIMPFGPGFVLSLASSYALSNDALIVVWGATKDDGLKRVEYKDNFGKGLAKLISSTYGIDFQILTPFAEAHKHEVLSCFRDKPDLFAKTWSCTRGCDTQSGDDGASRSRRLAAHLAGIEDRTAYMQQELEIPEKLKNASDPINLTDDEWIELFGSEKPHDI